MSPLHAATKQYVDANPPPTGVINVALPPYNAKLDGVTDDTAAFKASYLAAQPGAAIYVPFGTTVLQQPGTWGIALTKRVKWFVDGTTLADGTPLASCVPGGGGPANLVLPGFVQGNTTTGLATSQGGSQATDIAVQQSAYIVGHNGGAGVISNSRVDTIIYNSPGSFRLGRSGSPHLGRDPNPNRSFSRAACWPLYPDTTVECNKWIERAAVATAPAMGRLL